MLFIADFSLSESSSNSLRSIHVLCMLAMDEKAILDNSCRMRSLVMSDLFFVLPATL